MEPELRLELAHRLADERDLGPHRARYTLEFFIDVQNLYNRENVAGFSVDERNFELLPSGEVLYTPTEEEWLGLLPSFGVSWKF